MLIPALLLALLLALLAWFVRRDGAEYAAFKAVESSEERQRIFRRWTLRSFLLFSGSAVLALILLGRPEALIHMPPEFREAARAIASQTAETGDVSSGFLAGISIALVAGAGLGLMVARRRRRAVRDPPRVIGDIEPLLPRNAAERKWVALLAANAGPGEELFFRLVLPLLLMLLTGNAWLAFGATAIVFGAVHYYQGLVGVAATMAVGLFFTGIYLATGSIWLAALIHSLMNLNTLWLRPLLNGRAARR
jgi:membrane protease YdiL (CAAX protease family)